MPTVRQPRRKRSAYRSLPVWFQWGLPFGVALVAVIALIAFVDHQTNDTPSEAQVNSPSAIVAQNKQADATMAQEQAPKFATLKPGVRPATGLRDAIATWLDRQIELDRYNGPLQSGSCTSTKGSTTARAAFYCPMVTANVTYPFYGVVIPATGKITYCQKIKYPPVYGMPGLRLSKSCLAS